MEGRTVQMHLDQATLGVIFGIVNLIGLVYAVAFKMADNSRKIDTLWQIYVMDALHEARKQGVIRHDSPDHVDQKIVDALGDLTVQLRQLHQRTTFSQASDSELMFLIAQHFAHELIARLGHLPNMNLARALAAALVIAKGDSQ